RRALRSDLAVPVRVRCLLLCRFLDAGNDETALALGRPASKKRQGTKSREVWRYVARRQCLLIVLTLPPGYAVLSAGCRPPGSCPRAAGWSAATSCRWPKADDLRAATKSSAF